MARFIEPVLGEDASQIHLPGLGGAIGLVAFAPGQLLPAHREGEDEGVSPIIFTFGA
jgi:hypothetical protein